MTTQTANSRLRPFRPQRFGRYTLLSPISTGGMGEIFLGRIEGAHGFDKLCVIKKILPHLAEDADFVERFVDEARILVKLSHGNIAQVLDMGVHEGAPYIALEFVDGKDLRRVLARMRDRKLHIPISFILTVMTRVLDALAYAHRKRGEDDRELNLVHRDISPQNVLISYEGEVKIIDFGLAKSTLSSSKTNPSIILGKFMYMSPEQARHQTVDRRSDLYAVGLCIYELVTGHNPFEAVPPGELMVKVANPEIPPLHQTEPLTPMALSEAVMRALEPDPARRFQTAEEFRGRLQAVLLSIDPSAGAETTSRFMRECFGVEYHAERRMLASLKAQARQPEAEPEPPAEEAPTAQMPVTRSTAVTREVELPHAAVQAEALSFLPTPKLTGSEAPFDEAETRPAIPQPSPTEAPRRRDEEPTEAASRSLPPPADASLPSVLIEGLPFEPVHTELEMPAQSPPPSPARAPQKAARADKERGETSGVKRSPARTRSGQQRARGEAPAGRAASQKGNSAAPSPPRPALTQETPRTRAGKPATAARAHGSGFWVWLMVPLLAVLGVGSYIGWDLYTERLAEQQRLRQRQAEEALEATAEPGGDEPERSREVRVGAPDEPEVELPELPAPTPKATKAVRKRPSTKSPVDEAFDQMRADYDRFDDDSQRAEFKQAFTKLNIDRATGDPEAVLKEVKALHARIRRKLEQQ